MNAPGMNSADTLDQIAVALQQWAESRADVDAVWVFGSVAKGKTRPGSDTDIAVLFAHGKQPRGMEKLDLMMELSDCIGGDVDVVIMNTVGELLSNQVLRFGTKVYSRDAVRTALFEIAEWGKYSDYERIRNTIISIRKKQINGQR